MVTELYHSAASVASRNNRSPRSTLLTPSDMHSSLLVVAVPQPVVAAMRVAAYWQNRTDSVAVRRCCIRLDLSAAIEDIDSWMDRRRSVSRH